MPHASAAPLILIGLLAKRGVPGALSRKCSLTLGRGELFTGFVSFLSREGAYISAACLALLWGLVFNLQGGEGNEMPSLLLLRKEAVKWIFTAYMPRVA